jgi:oxygen-independent coproporphyrinogen III oxidase
MTYGIYIHLPFCRVHCTYCPFAISTDLSLQDRYTDALVREIASRPPAVADSVFLGGGTPSRMSVVNLRRIAEAVRSRFELTGDVEFSMEANPEDVTDENLGEWLALGVNRLSIGVQSFEDSELHPLGRVHGSELANEAVRRAARSGVRTNLDLIAGLPGQSVESFRHSLERAIECGAGHLSLYMLDLEEKTPLETQVRRGRVTIPDDELVAEMYLTAIETLAAGGLQQYEISNFARPGEECRHNLRYWTRGEYFGLGMSAHSFLGGERFANTRNIREYIERAPEATDFREVLGETEERRERIFLGLRRTWGLHYREIFELCGEEGDEWIERGLREGWLRREGERVALTPSGFLSSTELISQLF